ncbi:MAG: hypothetical protein WAN65_22400 [Candidatus Sulfotelmatobacter sp.]
MHDLRAPVMIRVDVSWVDESGSVQTTCACIEDKSVGGACIRIKIPINISSKLNIQGPWEQFSGTVKYCRSEGKEYFVGIQRDPSPNASLVPAQAAVQPPPVTSDNLLLEPASAARAPNTVLRLESMPKPRERNRVEMFPKRPDSENSPPVRLVSNASLAPPRGFGRKTTHRERPRILQPQTSSPPGSYARPIELQANQPPQRLDAGKEMKRMSSKWFGMSSRQNKRDDSRTNGDEISSVSDEKDDFMPLSVTHPMERIPAQSSRSVPSFQVQLLPVEDIYRAAGIITPPKGYSVSKVVEMLRSEHIRSLSPEMRRAAVLMALDAAGVPLAQVQQDAKARKEALDSYESAQTQQVDAEWARKAEEISQIQSELESIKAHYQARITRNLEGVAREKATFGTWQTMKQQEVESMAEAAELCSKAIAPKPAPAPAAPPDASAAAAAGQV